MLNCKSRNGKRVHTSYLAGVRQFAEFTELGLATGLETADTDEPRQIQNELESRGRYLNVVFYLTN